MVCVVGEGKTGEETAISSTASCAPREGSQLLPEETVKPGGGEARHTLREV